MYFLSRDVVSRSILYSYIIMAGFWMGWLGYVLYEWLAMVRGIGIGIGIVSNS